jgi:4-carboxymuconolactone decarboxylase
VVASEPDAARPQPGDDQCFDATGQVAQLGGHLNRAMDNGLTQAEAAEAITQLAFYAGWPNAFSALPIAKEVFAKRSK